MAGVAGSRFQSPSLRGSGRFGGDPRRPLPPAYGVSIPFIAGQWSLLIVLALLLLAFLLFQSPSLRGSGRFLRRCGARGAAHRCFNPLHCGAVVASRRVFCGRSGDRRVSIPFIAGQWSLEKRGKWQQSAGMRFNPLHCGAVVAYGGRRSGRASHRVSIPFIAGQWSLDSAFLRLAQVLWFQSPSLRGSGRLWGSPRRTAG